jgi:hypothetical protein
MTLGEGSTIYLLGWRWEGLKTDNCVSTLLLENKRKGGTSAITLGKKPVIYQ